MVAPAPRHDAQVRRWIARELRARPPRAPSLIVTVWGDAIAPHGGAIMLPGLIRLLASLGINERLVRTSIFRLAREGWLEATPVGRRSLYRLTEEGGRRFEEAYRRIYVPTDRRWDGSWELLIAAGLSAGGRHALDRTLGWEGFGVLAPGVYARPAPIAVKGAPAMQSPGAGTTIIRVRAIDDETPDARSLTVAVPRAWDLAAIAGEYRRFLRRFGGVIDRFRAAGRGAHDPEHCFVVRTLLIHAYRRVMLRDPRLPSALLPLDWPGAAAYVLCRDFYRLTHRSAECHLAAVLEGPRGALPPANAAFYRRFGGLSD